MTRTVGIYLFDDVEVLDFAGPFEVFWTATRVHARRDPDGERPFAVLTIGDEQRLVHARGGLLVEAQYGISAHPRLDVLVVPGGEVGRELTRASVVDWIAETARASEITASVCTGAFLLAKAGVLDGRRATTHWEDLDELRRDFPAVDVISTGRWIDEGKVVTGAGISAGIDMSLHLVARLAGDDLATRTARQMQYIWQTE